jgi:hypothetical protein
VGTSVLPNHSGRGTDSDGALHTKWSVGAPNEALSELRLSRDPWVYSIFIGNIHQESSEKLFVDHLLQLGGRVAAHNSDKSFWADDGGSLFDSSPSLGNENPRLIKVFCAGGAFIEETQIFGRGIAIICEREHKIDGGWIDIIGRESGLRQGWEDKSPLSQFVSFQGITKREIGVVQNASLQSGDHYQQAGKQIEWYKNILEPTPRFLTAGVMVVVALIFWASASHFSGSPLRRYFGC